MRLFVSAVFRLTICFSSMMILVYLWFKGTCYGCDLLENKFGNFAANIFLIISVSSIIAALVCAAALL